jgi:hypothetical protein
MNQNIDEWGLKGDVLKRWAFYRIAGTRVQLRILMYQRLNPQT